MSGLPGLRYLPILLQAAVVTVELSVVVVVLGTALGTVLAVLARLLGRPGGMVLAVYVYVLRGVPLLVLVFGAYFCLPVLVADVSKTTAVVLAMTLYMAAFVAEITRGAMAGIPRGLTDAARSLGMPPMLALRRVVLPLAARSAVPPLVNRTVMTIKGTSLASVIGLWELSLAGREIIQRDLVPFQVFGLIALIYFLLCVSVARLGARLERRFAYEH